MKAFLNGLLLAFFLALGVLPASAQERILNFHSDIVVEADGTLDVTETIAVRAEGHLVSDRQSGAVAPADRSAGDTGLLPASLAPRGT